MTGYRWVPTLMLMTIFQIVSSAQVIVSKGVVDRNILTVFIIYIAFEWIYALLSYILRPKASLAVEFFAFFLTGINLVLITSADKADLYKQFAAFVLGIMAFIGLLLLISNIDRAMMMRTPMAVIAVCLLVITLIFAENINGAYNWIQIGGISVQLSELVKVAFIYVGAATLDKLQSTRSLTKYIIFAVICIGLLFLMRDLGTALIFFFTFLVLAFMRSGDIRTIALIIVAAIFVAALVVLMRSDYVMSRFSTYRHVWEDINGRGYQQSRVLIYIVSGGLFGVGIGNGKLKNVSAATEDLVFGVLCEEWGMILGLLVVLSFAFLAIHCIKCARATRSSFYAIASCAAGGLILFQLSLNVFGVTDLLPMTGVTLPFISRGGSSMISCWALLAFIKAADNNTFARLREDGS